jgi:hypothetical protein
MKRFLQEDSYGGALDDLGLTTDPLADNRYALGGANPVNFVETDGHMSVAVGTRPSCSWTNIFDPSYWRCLFKPVQKRYGTYYPYDAAWTLRPPPQPSSSNPNPPNVGGKNRIDNGIDTLIKHVGPIFAIGGSTIARIVWTGRGMPWGGGGAIYMKLDHPITQGHRYKGWYTAEHGYVNPKFKKDPHYHFKPGERVTLTKSGWQETGFLPNTFFPSLQASLSSQVPTQEGWDFLAFILKMKRLHHFAPGSHFAGTH